MSFEHLVVSSLLFILPAYITNATAALFGGRTPLDFTRSFKGHRVFGKGKTWQGLAAGILFGTAAANVLGFFVQGTPFALGSVGFHTLLGFLLASGALLGDLAASFTKRRLSIKPGARLLLVDQLDFVVGALLASSMLYAVSLEQAAFLLVVTPAAHLFLNFVGFKLKCKKVPY